MENKITPHHIFKGGTILIPPLVAGRTNAMTSQNTNPRASIGITILLPPFLARLGGWASICDVSMPRRHDASMSGCFAVPMSQTFNFSMCECLGSSTLWGLGRLGAGVLGPKLQALGPKLQALAPSTKPQAMCISYQNCFGKQQKIIPMWVTPHGAGRFTILTLCLGGGSIL